MFSRRFLSNLARQRIVKPLRTVETKEIPHPLAQQQAEGTNELARISEKHQQISQEVKHAIPVETGSQSIADLKWIPPPSISRTKQTELQKQMEDDEYLRHLPPPPRYNLNLSDPEDRKVHDNILQVMDRYLPRWDVFRIPIWTNKRWFDYALWSYLGLLSFYVILFGKWDQLNEGEEHVFSGIRRWVFGHWASLNSGVSDEKVAETYRELVLVSKTNTSKTE